MLITNQIVNIKSNAGYGGHLNVQWLEYLKDLKFAGTLKSSERKKEGLDDHSQVKYLLPQLVLILRFSLTSSSIHQQGILPIFFSR